MAADIVDSIPGAESFGSSIKQATIPLGNRVELAELFSFPNHSSHQRSPATNSNDSSHAQESVDAKEQHNTEMSLEQTIQHYLTSSILRDGYSESSIHIAKSKPKIGIDMSNKHDYSNNNDDQLYASISGNAAVSYSQALPQFLKIGKLGLQACQQAQADGLWRENWRFFLPLGLPLTRHWTVELLHFPPSYTLEEDQDYLASRSTQRWKQLLTVNNSDENKQTTKTVQPDLVSLSPKDDDQKGDEPTDRFQAIIDIVPIAAPSSDGKNMKDVYTYFQDYISASLAFWASNTTTTGGQEDSTQKAKPIIAFGWPVKCWVEANQAQHHCKNVYPTSTTLKNNEEENGSDTLSLEVLSLTRIPIETTDNNHASSTQVLIANHPSYLYNAGKRMTSNTIRSLGEDECTLLEKIMIQDLIAARWQVRMGLEPSQDPDRILQECCEFWRDASSLEEIHALINAQAFILQ
ncbi:unnamed protein product [Cylindrotheca closterium]|uniref:Uncharacterized protein n=1 Tax=Cylindrotheca closterium TaxID=2856 RepID=A0AAD2CPS1_9STRA|nr:unnamed protein product [Cylindrotheca closterium]